jgi:phosphoenolpyruvate-protein kinase (PTS system EI component)
MAERLLTGTPASPGIALGMTWWLGEETDGAGPVAPDRRPAERDRALAALAAAADEIMELASGLADAEAEIVETGAMMGRDPVLLRAVEAAILEDGLTATAAVARTTEWHAVAIAAIGDETLAARADDVRSLGRRAARLAAGSHAARPPLTDLVLLTRDLGPADVAELAPELAGIGLLGGGATAHAAIVARSLGLPMVTGLGERLLEVAEGATAVLDGSRGTLIVEPSLAHAAHAARDIEARRDEADRARGERHRAAVTTDGTVITVLANVASPQELTAGLHAGAEGIGLLRTELAFLEARDWPSEAEHARAVEPILAGLGELPAVVRVLDFGADKSPPFLAGTPMRGLELLLAHPRSFAGQLRAILHAAQSRDVRILLPMVDTRAQLNQALAQIRQAASELGLERLPRVGAMIETPTAADNAFAIAERSGFLSVGTNDLTATALAADRFTANSARAHDPRVLRLIARSVKAAHAASITIEVCGEAASDPVMLPLLVGLGVDELSVGAARVGQVRQWVRQLSAEQAAELAGQALTMSSADEVTSATAALANRLASDGMNGAPVPPLS